MSTETPKTGMQPINPESLGAPKGYSNGMLAPAGGRMLAVAGQIAWDASQEIVSGQFHRQFEQALANVLDVVRAVKGGPEHIASLTIYVVDKGEYLDQLKDVGRAYRELMGRNFPAMALVEVSALLEPLAKVEIQALAVVPG